MNRSMIKKISLRLSALTLALLFALSLTALLPRNALKGRAAGVTVVETYSGSTLTYRGEFSDPESAWSVATSLTNVIVTLGSDWNLTKMVPISTNATIDLNGHTINRGRDGKQVSNGALFCVTKDVTLTIKDSDPLSVGYDGIRGGVLTGGASTDTAGCFEILGGNVYMEGGTVYNCTTDLDGGAVRMKEGSFKMTGARIYFCRTVDSVDSCNGGGIYVDEGTVELVDSKIDNCYSEDYGGAIYTENASITLNNVIISGNKCLNYGGGICIWDDTDFTARNCHFVNNRAEERGGAVYVDDAPDNSQVILFERCNFRDNEAGKDGGAMYVNDDSVGLSNVEMTGNYAKNRGGAVFVECDYDITVRGLMIIKDNKCDKASMSNLTLEFGTFSDAKIMNSGLYSGSCIYIGTTGDEDNNTFGYSDGDIVLSYKDIGRSQWTYFHADEGKIVFQKLAYRKTPLVSSASIFGNGSIWITVVLGSLGIIAAIAVIVVKKKKNRVAKSGKETK